MKGKKYTAAEKHFIKKQQGYEKQIKSLEEEIRDFIEERKEIKDENFQLKTNNIQLKEWIERLLKYTELSQDDIKQACEKDKEVANMFKTINMFSGIMNY